MNDLLENLQKFAAKGKAYSHHGVLHRRTNSPKKILHTPYTERSMLRRNRPAYSTIQIRPLPIGEGKFQVLFYIIEQYMPEGRFSEEYETLVHQSTLSIKKLKKLVELEEFSL
jgi:hypothetical protein